MARIGRESQEVSHCDSSPQNDARRARASQLFRRHAERYLRFFERFARHFGKSPDKLGPEHLRTYRGYLLKQRKLAAGSVENHVVAPRFLYLRTLHGHEFPRFLPYPKVPRKLSNAHSST